MNFRSKTFSISIQFYLDFYIFLSGILKLEIPKYNQLFSLKIQIFGHYKKHSTTCHGCRNPDKQKNHIENDLLLLVSTTNKPICQLVLRFLSFYFFIDLPKMIDWYVFYMTKFKYLIVSTVRQKQMYVIIELVSNESIRSGTF